MIAYPEASLAVQKPKARQERGASRLCALGALFMKSALRALGFFDCETPFWIETWFKIIVKVIFRVPFVFRNEEFEEFELSTG